MAGDQPDVLRPEHRELRIRGEPGLDLVNRFAERIRHRGERRFVHLTVLRTNPAFPEHLCNSLHKSLIMGSNTQPSVLKIVRRVCKSCLPAHIPTVVSTHGLAWLLSLIAIQEPRCPECRIIHRHYLATFPLIPGRQGLSLQARSPRKPPIVSFSLLALSSIVCLAQEGMKSRLMVTFPSLRQRRPW